MRLLLKLIGTAVILLFLPLLVLELAMSIWYKAEIVKELQAIANDGLESSASFDDIEVSAIRNFPDLTISILGLSIKENKYEILYADEISLHANLLAIYEENYSLSKLEVISPKFYAPIDSTGQKFMIKPKVNSDNKSRISVLLDIPKIEIRDALIVAHNMYKGNKIRIAVDKGDFRLRSFDDLLEFKGEASGVLDTMISKGKLNQTAVPIAAHQTTFRFNTLDNRKLFDGILQLYDAQLRAYGLLKPTGNGNLLDITLEGDEARLNDYLTLIPQFKPLKLKQLNQDARLTLTIHNSGFVDPVSFPNVDIIFELKDGVFSRIGLPGVVDSVNIKGHFSNGKNRNASTSEMIVDFGRAKVNDSFFEISGFIRNFEDPYIEVKASSEIELKDVKKLLDFPDLEMDGSVAVFADFHGKFSELEEIHRSNSHYFNGHIKFEDVWINKKPSNIKIENLNGKVTVKNTQLSMSGLSARFNDAQVRITGSTQNFIPLVEQKSGKKSFAKVSVSVDGLTLTEGDFASDQKDDRSDLEAFRFPKFLNLICDVNMKEFAYENYRAESINLNLALNNDSMSLRTGHFKFDEGDVWLGAVSRPTAGREKDYELWLKANLDYLDTKKYLPSKEKAVKSEQASKPDYSNITVHTDLKIKKLRHDEFEFERIKVLAELKKNQMSTKTLDFNFPYGSVKSSFDMALLDSVYHVSGNSKVVLHAFHIDSVKQYYNSIKPKPEPNDSAKANGSSSFSFQKFTCNLSSPRIDYQDYEVSNFLAKATIAEGQVRLERADFEMFDGNVHLAGLIKKDENHEVSAFCDIDAQGIDLGYITSSFGGADKEMFSKQHFKGDIGFNGQVLLNYNHELEHQEDEMLGKVKVSLSDGELIHFEPITESLKFIKQANRDTILMTNRNIEILFHNDEILLPTTTFKTTLSNIEFSGYRSNDFGLGFDLQISVGDLLFKSQKKKRQQVQNNKKASFGAIKYYLEARSVDGQMQIKSVKRSAYRNDLKRMALRYQQVDSVLSIFSSQIVQ